MRKLFIGINFFVLSMMPLPAHADSALETVKSRVTQVLAVLRDPAANKDAKVKRLRAIFDRSFDFLEMSRSTLSRNWDKLKPDQQKEFLELYRALLEKVYLDLLLQYKDQEVTFGRERGLGENRFEVDTKMISGSTETPINFRLVLKGSDWWVYDFVIENISVVSNYRSQFGRILTKQTPEEMLASLRKQVSAQ
jgi:phospholipid transport system substrate-binding protein